MTAMVPLKPESTVCRFVVKKANHGNMNVGLKLEVDDESFDAAITSVKVEPSTSYLGYDNDHKDTHGLAQDDTFRIKVENEVLGTIKTEYVHSEHEEKRSCVVNGFDNSDKSSEPRKHPSVCLDRGDSTGSSERNSSPRNPKRRGSVSEMLHGVPRKHVSGSMLKRVWDGRKYKTTDLCVRKGSSAEKPKRGSASESCWETEQLCGTNELDCLKSGLIEKRFHDDLREDEYRCSICGQSFCRVQNLKSHLRLAHLGKTFVCAVCDKAFAQPHYLQEHMKVHKRKRSSGSSAKPDNKDTKKNDSKKKDVKKKDGESVQEKANGKEPQNFAEPYKCSICDSNFGKIIDIQVHMRSHKMQKLQVCPVCGESFFDVFAKHLSMHSGKGPHSCVVCAQKFIHLGNLTRHFEKHTEDYPYKCAICERTFLKSFQLMKHVRTKHPDGSSTSSNQKSAKDV